MQRTDILLLTRLGEVRESKEHSCYEEHTAHDKQAWTENLFYLILEEYAYDTHRNHRDDDIEGILCFLIHLELEESLQNPINFFPQNDQCTQHGCYMNHDSKSKVILSVNAKKISTDSQMTATAYRQILCETLNESQH